MNRLERAAFGDLLTRCGYERKDGLFLAPRGVILEHVAGDAADFDILKSVLAAHPVDTGIVLGTDAGGEDAPPPRARDDRVLNILMALRRLHATAPEAPPLHVVGENMVDETTMLASTRAGSRNCALPSRYSFFVCSVGRACS